MIPDWLRDNPFWVLGLEPTATRLEIERAGQKLLGLLAIGSSAAARHRTPWGDAPRDESLVRGALAQLRDPVKRVRAELWYTPPAPGPGSDGAPPTEGPPATDTEEDLAADLFAAIGWRGRCR